MEGGVYLGHVCHYTCVLHALGWVHKLVSPLELRAYNWGYMRGSPINENIHIHVHTYTYEPWSLPHRRPSFLDLSYAVQRIIMGLAYTRNPKHPLTCLLLPSPEVEPPLHNIRCHVSERIDSDISGYERISWDLEGDSGIQRAM